MYTKAKYNILRHICCFTTFKSPLSQLDFEIIMRQWKTKHKSGSWPSHLRDGIPLIRPAELHQCRQKHRWWRARDQREDIPGAQSLRVNAPECGHLMNLVKHAVQPLQNEDEGGTNGLCRPIGDG